MDTNFNNPGAMKSFIWILITASAVIFFMLQLSACSLIFLPPAIPTAPSPVDGATNVSINTHLEWKSQSNTNYSLYFGTSKSPQLIAQNLSKANYTFSSPLNYSTTYYWKVKAKNFSGEKTSALWKFTTQDIPRPKSPSNLKYQWIGSNAVSLSWQDNSTNETGFVIERKSENGFSKIATLSQNTLSYRDLNLIPSTNYSYKVYAFNSYGTSTFSNELTVKTSSASAGTLKWKYKIGPILYTPAMDLKETIYFSSQSGTLYAVNSLGALIWKYPIGMATSSPALDENSNYIYIGNDQGTFYSFTSDGALRWEVHLSSFLTCPSIGASDVVYVHAGDYLYAIYKSNGKIKWKYEVGFSSSSPAIGRSGTIYVGGKDWYLYALNNNGTLKWKYKTGPLFSMPLASSPSLDDDENVYIEGVDWYLYCIDSNGNTKWKYKSSSLKNFASPSIDFNGNIYMIGGDGELYVVKKNGKLNWSYASDKLLTSPTLGQNGEIYIGGMNGLYVIENGILKWEYSADSVHSNPILKNGTIYFGSDDGYLYAIHASSDEMMNSAWPTFNHDIFRSGREK
jgi:outer membrane protein assembly factor BamB